MGTRGSDLRTVQSDYASLDDRMLVLDFQAGHPEAFVEIHHRYGPLARRVCGRYLPNGQDADEAFQETMIRVFQGLHRFNGRYALRPWIARIAANVAIDALRARDRRPEIDGDPVDLHDADDRDDGPERAYERLVERDLVISVLEELPETHRTALVLRELEGRSHREIGHAMGLTAPQAKALIHRAKGSFRRGWLRAITERGGLAGIAMLPLIWSVRVFDGARRVADRIAGHAGQVAQAATPEVVSSAASSPTVTTAVTSVGERVVATGVAVLLAGSVTVGAASLAKRDAPEDPVKVEAAAPPVDEGAPAAVPVVAPREERPERDRPAADDRQVPVEEAPPTTSDTGTAGSPSPPPTESPSPPPAQEPPPIPPAPEWASTFVSTVDLGTVPLTQIRPEKVVGSAGHDLLFSEALSGPRIAADGSRIGGVYLEYWGSVSGNAGTASVMMFIDGAGGSYGYQTSGSLRSITQEADGTWTYRFGGQYSISQLPQVTSAASGTDPMPHDGTFELTFRLWQDGRTLYQVDLSLQETAA